MAEQAQEMVVDATPKKTAFMNKRSTHEDRIKKDEEELEQLKKQALGETEETVKEEETTEKEEEPTSAEEKTFKKRYGDLRRHSQEKEKAFQKQLDDLKSQLEKATKKEIKLPKTEAEIEKSVSHQVKLLFNHHLKTAVRVCPTFFVIFLVVHLVGVVKILHFMLPTMLQNPNYQVIIWFHSLLCNENSNSTAKH